MQDSVSHKMSDYNNKSMSSRTAAVHLKATRATSNYLKSTLKALIVRSHMLEVQEGLVGSNVVKWFIQMNAVLVTAIPATGTEDVCPSWDDRC